VLPLPSFFYAQKMTNHRSRSQAPSLWAVWIVLLLPNGHQNRGALAQQEAQRCLICEDGSEMQAPDRIVFVSPDMATCAELELNEAGYFNSSNCRQEIQDAPIDLPAYCRCPGTETRSRSCDYCVGGTVINNDEEITPPELGITLKCEEADLVTPFLTDTDFCLSFKLSFGPTCCQMSLDQTPEKQEPSSTGCSICPDGSSMQNPDKELFFVGAGITCQTADSILADVAEDQCTLAKENFERFPFDIGAWCECTGTTVPNACQLCSRSPDGRLINDDAEVDLSNNVTVTCLEAEQLAPYITDSDVCERDYEAAVGQCCFGVPTAPVAPAPAPLSSPAPTFPIPPPSPPSTPTSSSSGVSLTRGNVSYAACIQFLIVIATAATCFW